MRRTHYLRERKKLESWAKELRAELDRVDRRIAALDVVWNEIFNESAEQPKLVLMMPDEELLDLTSTDSVGQTLENDPAQPTVASDGTIGKAIESVVSFFDGDFGVKEVESLIVAKHPALIVDRTTIAGKLRKMTKGGHLELVVQGRGRRPSSFRKATGNTETKST
ncbi:MAG: hypothetical protein ABSH08_06415 [Tepidisphaeraceae bacterium]|jgi:hypothetical protein